VVLLLLLEHVDEVGFGDVVVLPEELVELFLAPVGEGTAVVLVLPGSWAGDDIPAVLGPLHLFLADESVGVVDVVHVALEVGDGDLAHKVLAEVLLVVVRVHAAALEEEPQLSAALMLEVVELLEAGVEVHHAGREEALPQGVHVLEGEFELAAGEGGVVEVAGVERLQRAADEGAHLVLAVAVEHLDDWPAHLLQLALQEGRVEVGHQLAHARNSHVDVAAPHEAEPLPQPHLSELQRHHCELLRHLVLLVHDLAGEAHPVLDRHVEVLGLAFEEEGEEAFEQLHVAHARLEVGGESAFELDGQDELLHLHELGVVAGVVAVEHPADEVRNQVFAAGACVLELAQQVDVELALLAGGRQLRVLVDPALVAAQGLDLFVAEGLELLEEVDAPGGVAHHFVAGGLVRQRGGVDEAVEVFGGTHAHFAPNYYI
jgi:hypothetical protein